MYSTFRYPFPYSIVHSQYIVPGIHYNRVRTFFAELEKIAKKLLYSMSVKENARSFCAPDLLHSLILGARSSRFLVVSASTLIQTECSFAHIHRKLVDMAMANERRATEQPAAAAVRPRNPLRSNPSIFTAKSIVDKPRYRNTRGNW